MQFLDIIQLVADWDKARSHVCSMTTYDPRYREALNKLSQSEDILSNKIRQLGLGAK